ncbi:YjbF family lipoprotein [Gymnodinialimonas hymeniacidonis]|uniref:YjbF family lipoprotein n=1 Tax=Gymnodinialimonas hymeniacidonis TaxID=3126508 RepID=UPI0034C6B56C
MALKGVMAGLAASALLAGCGSEANDPLLGAARAIGTSLLTRNAPETPPVDPRAVLTREAINRAGVPLILLERQSAGTSSTLTRIATNGPNETWQGDDDLTVTLSREGVLRATRGYLHDLYSADISAVRQALVQRSGGSAPRVHTRVVGDLETLVASYICEVGFAGSERINIFGRVQTLTRVVERCSAQPGSDLADFENRYWIDGSGMAWASEQYAGPDLGHLRIERLHR